ncbi:putative P-loop containing nucleoside triphosphate hydrolase, leucine-rich repeat domain superfamily [Helianthus debilis subsp. tardiflorus]
MAEVIVNILVEVLSQKLASIDFSNLGRPEAIDPQLKKWETDLRVIKAVLDDAGQKQISQKAVELWLHELQDLAYDIDDFVDDLTTEGMMRKFHQQSHARTNTSKSWKNMIPSCLGSCTNFTPSNLTYDLGLGSKGAKITEKLNDLVDKKNKLGLDVNVKVERSNKPLEQTSLVDESKVMGREVDKVALLRKLLGNEACNQNVSVVSIVGLGGIGKTTLAKVLYNDKNVKSHFTLRAWVSVSNEFDVAGISKAIFQALGGGQEQFDSLNLLHEALKEKLEGKKFLVVLDGVWNENHEKWERLRSPFVVGAPGSKIIITTQKTEVATVMNSVQPYNLEVLSDEIALSLFAKYALDEENFDNHPSLGTIALSIVKKCKGLPMALITLARVLKTKERSDVEWKMITDSEIWNLDENGILPALKLSYYDLPSYLKPLFAYCSLFPKNYEFDKKELVLLWMAEGFLSRLGGNRSMENAGRQCFEELQSRSFFQHSTAQKSRYTMHDSMNALAKSVAGEFFFLDDEMYVNGRNEASEKLRHFSFIGQRRCVVYEKFEGIDRASRLRTFLPVSISWQPFNPLDSDLVQLLPGLKFLRVLSLTNYSITEVPQSIDSLKHLRYLNFSRTIIEGLPEQVGNLYNLQSLLVRDCEMLSSLPVSFAKLRNLRHFDISGTPLLNKTPLGIGGSISLQTLPKVYIEGGKGFKVSELKDLLGLQGRLSIKGLDKVMNPIQAKDANLHQKEGLDDLEMEWNEDVLDNSRNSMIEYEVFEGLRPHCKLKTLRILFYGGIKFPSWVGDETKLIS